MKPNAAAIAIGLVLLVGWLKRWEVGEAALDAVLPVSDDATDTVARTLWGEARGEGQTGMQAVANVIMNRVRIGGWWGATPVNVCRKPWQFSCWNPTDPNAVKLRQVDQTDANFRAALNIAARAVAGDLPDITGGATHYHAPGVNPAWANGAILTKVIGNHRFYRGVR